MAMRGKFGVQSPKNSFQVQHIATVLYFFYNAKYSQEYCCKSIQECGDEQSASSCLYNSREQYNSVLAGALNQQDRTQREVKMSSRVT